MESSNLYRVNKEEDLEKLIRLLTVCFAEDPLYQALIPDKETRDRLTEHDAALHNLLVDFFAVLKTDSYLIKEDPSLVTLWKFIQGKDYLNSSWTSQLHSNQRLHVIYLAVAPKAQHHGLAEKLMDEVIDYAYKNKLMISLETHNQYCMIKQA